MKKQTSSDAPRELVESLSPPLSDTHLSAVLHLEKSLTHLSDGHYAYTPSPRFDLLTERSKRLQPAGNIMPHQTMENNTVKESAEQTSVCVCECVCVCAAVVAAGAMWHRKSRLRSLSGCDPPGQTFVPFQQ